MLNLFNYIIFFSFVFFFIFNIFFLIFFFFLINIFKKLLFFFIHIFFFFKLSMCVRKLYVFFFEFFLYFLEFFFYILRIPTYLPGKFVSKFKEAFFVYFSISGILVEYGLTIDTASRPLIEIEVVDIYTSYNNNVPIYTYIQSGIPLDPDFFFFMRIKHLFFHRDILL